MLPSLPTIILITALTGAPDAATVCEQEKAAPPGPATLTACTLLTGDEIKAALGRTELVTPRRATALPNGGTECRYFGQGRGDVRILLEPTREKDDVTLRGKILTDEGVKFERIGGLGRGAYYWDDRLQVFVGTSTVTMWVTRSQSTEPPAKVREALITLAKQAITRLGR